MNTDSVDSFAQLCKCQRRLKLLLIIEKSLARRRGLLKLLQLQLARCDYTHVAVAAITLALCSAARFKLMELLLKLKGTMTFSSHLRGICQTK